ncbi:MAG TPA: ribonuclease HII [Spirochaetota bacterium]|nr:ribonuclease HII [Spirochaetota bacterium]
MAIYHFERDSMCALENLALTEGYTAVGGIDEAGRGALAGPVVAACVVLDPQDIPSGILDSKKLTDKKRRSLYREIKDRARAVGIGLAGPRIIDEINIYNASALAMKRAVLNLDRQPDFLLIDAVKLYDISISSKSIFKGEDKSVSIAAASIIAKVYRDDLMISFSRRYPQYSFQAHKGYATEAHRRALKMYGPTTIHRYSYRPVHEAFEQWK